MAGRPRTQSPPAAPRNDGADRSYGDHLAGQSPVNLDDMQDTWREEDARREVDDRHEMLDRAQAEGAGIPYSVWLQLTPQQRSSFADQSLNQLRESLNQPAQPRLEDYRFVDSNALSALRSPEEFERYALGMIGPEHKNIRGEPVYTIMCDPPIEINVDGEPLRYHPDTSYISIKQVGQKRAVGFTARPRYPFLPKPDLPCQLDDVAVYGLSGKPCSYKGRTREDVEMHMQFGHPAEYRNLQNRLDRERRQQEIDDQRETRKAMVTLMERIVGRESEKEPV